MATKKTVKKAVKKKAKKTVKKPTKPNKKDQKRTIDKKKAILKALEKNLGDITKSCDDVNINRCTFYEWKDNDPEFAKVVETMPQLIFDFALSYVKTFIANGNAKAAVALMKLYAPKVGIIPTQKVIGKVHTMNDEVSQMSEEEVDRELSNFAKRGI